MKTNKALLLLALSTCLPIGVGSSLAANISQPYSGQNGAQSELYISVSSQEEKAEAFINKMGMTAVAFLSNPNLTPSQKKSEFKKLLRTNFDMATIGRFALGKNWRLASASEQKEYLNLFEKMVVEVYSKRFDDYQGQSFELKSSRPIGEKDSLVSTMIVPETGPKIDVDWRVRNKNGKMQIIDVVIEGVSMSLTQRSDFASVVQRGGGKIEPLLAHLRK